MTKTLGALLASAVALSAQAHPECMDVETTPCSAFIQGAKFTLSTSGEVSAGSVSVHIPLPNGLYVEEAEFESLGESTLLALGITDVEASSTLLVLINNQPLKVLWSTEIGAFNASPMLVADGAVYLAAIGTVSKVRLNDGKVQWKHGGLYENNTQAYNSFVRPRKEAGVVIFTENKVTPSKYPGTRAVRVEDKTGKILEK